MNMYNHVFLVTAEGPDGTEIDFDIEAVDQEDCIKKCKMMLGHDVMVTYIEDEGVNDEDESFASESEAQEDGPVYAEDSETPIDAGLEDTPDETSEGIPETYGDVESFTPDIDVTEV